MQRPRETLGGCCATCVENGWQNPIEIYYEHPNGLKEKLKEFESTVLSQQHSVQCKNVGIVGLGEVGKTTLAKKLFNAKRSDYSGTSLLFDVRENSTKGSLTSLQ